MDLYTLHKIKAESSPNKRNDQKQKPGSVRVPQQTMQVQITRCHKQKPVLTR